MEWYKFENIDDVASCVGLNQEILIYDGLNYHIDIIRDAGIHRGYYMSEDTEPEFYSVLTNPE